MRCWLVAIALTAIAAGLATPGTPARQPRLLGTLNLLCSAQIPWCKGMQTEFQKVYPKVTVECVRLSSGEALTRLCDERANPQFDIVPPARARPISLLGEQLGSSRPSA